MRYATLSQNGFNKTKDTTKHTTSIYKGVSREGRKWRGAVRFQGKDYYLGSYDNEEEAAMAYNIKALELAGQYACLNNS